MVLPLLRQLLSDRFGCDADEVELSATLDDLNLYPDDLTEIAMWCGEAFGVDITTEDMTDWTTVEDIVGYVEDRL